MDPLVTCVLLTTHPKRAAYLPDAVASYRAQTYANKELIVINDGEPLVSGASDIRVVNLPAKRDGRRWSIGEKRNVGIRFANGEWLATWDDDDVSLGHRLAEQLAYATENEFDCVIGDRTAVADENMVVVGNCTLEHGLVMATLLISRDYAVRAGGYLADDFAEDQAFRFRGQLLVRTRCGEMRGVDWYVVRRHESNITSEFGDSKDSWVRCAMLDPKRIETQRLVDAVRAIDTSGSLVTGDLVGGLGRIWDQLRAGR